MANYQYMMSADDVARELNCSKSHAYKLVKSMNEELASQGYITMAGRIPRAYWAKKMYGYELSVDRELMYKLRTSWNRKGGKSINSDTNVHVGSLPSGAAVIQTEELVSDYIELHNRKMLGLDMETYAVYYAAENAPTRPLFVSIKSVSDYANSKKNDDYQAYASYISISLFLEKLPELIEIY